jgi:hypothetical protein
MSNEKVSRRKTLAHALGSVIDRSDLGSKKGPSRSGSHALQPAAYLRVIRD